MLQVGREARDALYLVILFKVQEFGTPNLI